QHAALKGRLLNPATVESLKYSLKELIAQIDKRLKVLYDLNSKYDMHSSKGYGILKLMAAHYIKDCRDILTNDITQIIDSYKYSSRQAAKPATPEIERYKLRKQLLISDGSRYKTFSKI